MFGRTKQRHGPPDGPFSHSDDCRIVGADPDVELPWSEVEAGHWTRTCVCSEFVSPGCPLSATGDRAKRLRVWWGTGAFRRKRHRRDARFGCLTFHGELVNAAKGPVAWLSDQPEVQVAGTDPPLERILAPWPTAIGLF
jgi:hypothetical protein